MSKMKNALVLEPDRVMADCLRREFAKQNIKTHTVSSPEQAIKIADESKPDIIIVELSLPGHSGTEFLYEFRSYDDWADVPLIIHSSIKVADSISSSSDWKLLKISKYLYKPTTSLQKLIDESLNLLEV